VNPSEPAGEPALQIPEEIRRFYERMPYPAPFTTLDEHRELYRNTDRRRAQFHLMWPAEPLRESQEILVAGCGTSQAARYALREPGSRVTAIDISATSLRYTRELQQKYRLENLELHQLPVERVRTLGRTFDQVICTGVLHHLPDPDLGLAALREVLGRHGAMQLMVYAPYGRAGIYMMQEYCRLLGVAATPEELRDLDSVLDALPGDHPLAALMQGAKDFRHPEALADALLHPLDRAYSVPQLYAWLERCGLVFARWVQQAPYLPQCGAVAKTRHAARLAALPEPAQHAALELLRGTMVRHSLIAYRSDRAGERQPIRFDARCESYVPIPVPWTVCVRERLPPGCAAVLINRAHPFTDLILTVDPLEDRLFTDIDGRRTVAQILELAGAGGEDARRRGREFFERLWQYDQVVFDASRGG
jgi:SAM-dependent methyltransferase